LTSDDAERANNITVGGKQRMSGVETDPGVVGYQRVVGKARVSRGILDDEYPGAVHSMTAERRFAAGGSDVEATTGFEPLALCVD
jgi:hypothetical protein